MVGRTPVRDLSPARDIQPAAAPVDTYVRPATSERSPLHHVAQSLGGLSSSLQGFLSQRQGEADDDARLQGEAAFYRDHSGGYVEGTATGQIPPYASPAFQEGFGTAQGNVAGIQIRQDFNAEFAAWEDRHTASPEEFEAWFGEFVQGRLTTDDPNQLGSLLPHIRQLTDDAWGTYQRIRGERMIQESVTAHLGISSLTIDEAVNQSALRGGDVPYDVLWGEIVQQRDAALATGLGSNAYDTQLFNTIVAKALEHGDPSILEFLDETLPGQEIPIGQQPQFLADRIQAEGRMASLLATREEDLREQQEQQDQAREDAIVRGVMEFLQENPTGEIGDDIVAEWEVYNPQAREELAGLRSTFSRAQGVEDQDAILEIEMDILRGMTPAEVMQLGSSGVIRDPATLTRLYNRAVQRQEIGSQILESDAYKRYTERIEALTGDLVENSILGGTTPSPETIQALRDFDIAAMEWQIANPNATLIERERAIDEIGQLILGRIEGSQYAGQEEFQEGVSEIERNAPGGGEGAERQDRLEVIPGVGNPAAQSPDAQTESLLESLPSAGDELLQQLEVPDASQQLRSALEALLPEGMEVETVLQALQEQTGIPDLSDFAGVREQATQGVPQVEEDDAALTPYEIYNSDEPPTLNALSPELRQRIEQTAAETGQTPEEINMQFWQRIRERFFGDDEDEDVAGIDPTEFAPPSEPLQSPGLDAITEFMERAPSVEELRQFEPEPTHSGVDFTGVRPEAMDAVRQAGAIFGRPLPVTSAFRSQERQDAIRAQGDPNRVTVARSSWHTRGLAFDFSTEGMAEAEKARLVGALADAGFTGFGEYATHIHADMRERVPNSFGGRGGNWGGWTNLSQAVMRELQDRGFRAGMVGSRIDRSPPWTRTASNNDFPDRPTAPAIPRVSEQRTRTAASSTEPEVRMLAPVLDLIAITEGTGRPGSNDDNYNETLAYGRFTGGDVDLTSMTLDEIDALQTRMLRHPENRMRSSALGRYQFIRTTLRELRRVYDIPGDLRFTPEFQDWLAVQRMRQVRGLDDWMSGRLSTENFVNNLSQEWASLPRMDGRGTYRGQRVGASAQEVVAALQAARSGRS